MLWAGRREPELRPPQQGLSRAHLESSRPEAGGGRECLSSRSRGSGEELYWGEVAWSPRE